MSWSSVGDFNTLIGSGALTKTLAVYNDELYMGTIDSSPNQGQVWKTSSGAHTWSHVRDFGLTVGHLYTFGSKLYAVVNNAGADDPAASGIWSFNGSTWTFEKYISSGFSGRTAGFVTFDDNIWCVCGDEVYNSAGGGSWSLVSDATDAPNKYRLGVYDGNLYLSGRVGSSSTGTYYVRRYDSGNFSTAVFTEAAGGTPVDDRHYHARSIIEYIGNAYFIEPRYVHKYTGSATTLNNTFTYDSPSGEGIVDALVFNGKLWTGHIFDPGSPFPLSGGVYKYNNASWSLDSGLNYYSDDRTAPTYAPPCGFCKWNQGSGTVYYLYACAGPGEVWINTSETEDISSNVYITGGAASKDIDDRFYITGWRPTELFTRTYIISGDTLTGERETSLGSAALSSVTAKTLIAYPHTPLTGGDGRCYIFGRFTYSSSIRHVMRTVDGGSVWTIVEDGWGTDICAALLTRLGEVWCVRNKTTQAQLYRGFDELTYVSTLPFPINNGAFAISPDNKLLIVGTNIAGANRVYGAAYPFTTWVDITFNYPTSGEVTGIVVL